MPTKLDLYNQALLIEPKASHYYQVGESLPLRVYTSENVGGVDYSLNGAEWRALQGSGHGWWRGFYHRRYPPFSKGYQIAPQEINHGWLCC